MYKLISLSVVSLFIASCGPTGHYEWVQDWGDISLRQAQSECKFVSKAADMAVCLLSDSCFDENKKENKLLLLCLQARGWSRVYVEGLQPASSGQTISTPSDLGKTNNKCILPSGNEKAVTSKAECYQAGGTLF